MKSKTMHVHAQLHQEIQEYRQARKIIFDMTRQILIPRIVLKLEELVGELDRDIDVLCDLHPGGKHAKHKK